MRHALLGRSGLRVSRATLGTMNFGTGPGTACDEAEARRIVDVFLDAVSAPANRPVTGAPVAPPTAA